MGAQELYIAEYQTIIVSIAGRELTSCLGSESACKSIQIAPKQAYPSADLQEDSSIGNSSALLNMEFRGCCVDRSHQNFGNARV